MVACTGEGCGGAGASRSGPRERNGLSASVAPTRTSAARAGPASHQALRVRDRSVAGGRWPGAVRETAVTAGVVVLAFAPLRSTVVPPDIGLAVGIRKRRPHWRQ